MYRVLTKPDIIQEGDIDSWLDVLTGTKEKLRLGYFVVRNSSTKELKDGITFHTARSAESNFFASSPWCDLPSSTRARCGVGKLAEKLSVELEKFIVSK